MSIAERFGQLDACFSPFSSHVKTEIRANAGNRCEVCGKRGNLEAHHDVPQVFKGKDNAENGSLLCHKCHGRADFNVLEYGITRNGKTLNELPEFRFKNNYNPFKDMNIEKIPLPWRHDMMMMKVGKHTREYYDKMSGKKKEIKKEIKEEIETMPCPRQGWYT